MSRNHPEEETEIVTWNATNKKTLTRTETFKDCKGNEIFQKIERNIRFQSNIEKFLIIVLSLIVIGVVIYAFVKFEGLGRNLLINLIAGSLGMIITHILYEYYNKGKESLQKKPAKYLQYTRLLKQAQALSSALQIYKKQPATENCDQSQLFSLQRARERFEIAAYETAPYLESKEIYLIWPLLCDETLVKRENIVMLKELERWLKQEIERNVLIDNTTTQL
jgi:hypothetical protein